MIGPQVASRERSAYYRAQPPITAVASVMKLRRSNEHRRNDPTIPGRAGTEAAFSWHRATLHLRNGRSRCSRPLHRTATLAAVGALLSSFSAGFLSADAAQTRPRGSTGGTSAAF